VIFAVGVAELAKQVGDAKPIFVGKGPQIGRVRPGHADEGCVRRTVGDKYYWRINQFAMPFYTAVTGPFSKVWMPIDDYNTLVMEFSPSRPAGMPREYDDLTNMDTARQPWGYKPDNMMIPAIRTITAPVAVGAASKDGAPGLAPTPGTATFNNGATTSLVFPSHATGIALHVSLPNDQVTITLFNINDPILGLRLPGITAKFEFSGNHYHVIPEPATLALIASGVIVLGIRSVYARGRRRF